MPERFPSNAPEQAPIKKEQPKENIFQPFPFKGGFEKEKITDEGERKELSSEGMEKLDAMLDEVVRIFGNSEIKWEIDGGLSVSLLKGEYIGQHRDLDMAVEESQLEELQELVERNGFGLFVTLNTQQRETMVMKRVDAKEFSSAPTYLFWIIAVNDDGLIQKDRALSFINVHIVRRNEQGMPLNESGDELPAQWFESRQIQFHGKNINVAQPVKTAHYKLMSARNYDVSDIKHLVKTGNLSLEDIETVDLYLKQETQRKGQEFYIYRKRIIEKMKNWLME